MLATILDALAGILNLLAREIAFFTGADSVVQAQKAQVDYAASLDGTADSMKDVTQVAKEMRKQLLPFDELNVFDNDGSGGVSSGRIGNLRFEEVGVDPVNFPTLLKAPKWSPEVIKTPKFEMLQLPDILLNPLPVPEWAENPIMAPSLSLTPVLQGLAQMQEGFATTWESIKITATDGATSARAIFAQFVVDTAATLQTWGENLKTNFGSVMTCLQTVTVPALSNAASNFVQFVQNTADNIRAWGKNVASNVQATLVYIPTAVSSGLSAAAQSFATWINGTSSSFASWAKISFKTLLLRRKGWLKISSLVCPKRDRTSKARCLQWARKSVAGGQQTSRGRLRWQMVRQSLA